MEDKDYVRELKSKHSVYCLWGKCPDCSRIVNDKGIHDVEVYQVFECTEDEKCDNCDGKGYVENTCPHCDGLGIIEETCEECKGKGRMPDIFGERKLIKNEEILVKSVGQITQAPNVQTESSTTENKEEIGSLNYC